MEKLTVSTRRQCCFSTVQTIVTGKVILRQSSFLNSETNLFFQSNKVKKTECFYMEELLRADP